MQTTSLDEHGSFSWIAHPGEFMERASAAVAVDGGVLIVDPVDHPELDGRLGAIGPVVGVCQLLDRHERDCQRVAIRYGAPLLVPAALAGRGEPLAIAGVEERAIAAPLGWKEAALWLPERRLLIAADCIGSAGYFLTREGDRLGVHPFLRFRPPREALGDLAPRAIATGHGAAVTYRATEALTTALETARTGLPRAWARGARLVLSRRR